MSKGKEGLGMPRMIYNHDSKEVQYLIQKDPYLKPLLEKHKEVSISLSEDYFVSLVGTIVAQQLSSKVANVIYQRLETLCHHEITAEKIMQCDDEALRSIGLSYQKIKYVKSVASHMLDGTVHFDDLEQMSDQAIIDMLTQIKGIGVWSAQMFLMFSLGRQDVFSVLDLGLRNAVKKVYQNQDLTAAEIEKISETWKPYRSIASFYLWHAWDNA